MVKTFFFSGLYLKSGKKTLPFLFFFFDLHLNSENNSSVFGEDLFFCLPEKNRGRGSSPNVENRAKLG